MKKIISLIAICAATSSAFAAPQLVRRSARNEYNVTYDYRDKAKNGWYMTGRAGLSLLNFKNKYSADDRSYTESESYSFEPVFDGSLAFGKRFGYFVRGELEAGYIGNFTDKDMDMEYKLSVPYLTANVYYDFLSGFYVGAGLGVTLITMELDGEEFVDEGNRKERDIGFIGGINLGYTHKLDDNLILDLRYRLAGISGVKHTRDWLAPDSNIYDVTVKTGFIMDNTISLGIRYEF